MNAKEIIKLLVANGWTHQKTTGSHMGFKKGNQSVTVPYHGAKDIAIGTTHTILKKAGLK